MTGALTHTQQAIQVKVRAIQTGPGLQVAIGLMISLAVLPAWVLRLQRLVSESSAIVAALVELFQAFIMASSVFWNMGEIVVKAFAWGMIPCRI